MRELGLPEASAEDVYQSVITTLSEFAEERLQQINDLKAYAYRMLQREALRTCRKNSRIQVSIDEAPDRYSDGSASAERIQSGILLKDIWTLLNNEDRELLRLLIFGYEAKQIAGRLKISYDSARQKKSRLQKKLRELIFEVPNAE